MFHQSICVLPTLRLTPDSSAKSFPYLPIPLLYLLSPMEDITCLRSCTFFSPPSSLQTQLECQIKTWVQIFHLHFFSLLDHLKKTAEVLLPPTHFPLFWGLWQPGLVAVRAPGQKSSSSFKSSFGTWVPGLQQVTWHFSGGKAWWWHLIGMTRTVENVALHMELPRTSGVI